MRALFMDQSDQTYFTAEIELVQYDPESRQMIFWGIDDEEIYIPNICSDKAKEIARVLCEVGYIILEQYPAYFNEEPPGDDEPAAEAEKQKKLFGGLFSKKKEDLLN